MENRFGKNQIVCLFNHRVSLAERNPYRYAFAGPKADQLKTSIERRNKIRQRVCGIAGIIGVLAFVAILVALYLLVTGITVAKADSDVTDFPSYWRFDSRLVTSVQETLNDYGEEVAIDGIFGAETGTGVKHLQQRYGLAVTGTVDDEFARFFHVKNWVYNQNITMFYMADLESIYAKSKYEDIIYTCTGGCEYDPENPTKTGSHTFLFRDGELIADCGSITGNDAKGYFTPLGVRHIKGRKPTTSGRYSDYYYLMHIGNLIYIHSTLDYFDPARDNQILGAHQSDGSIRVPTDFAKWLYENEPKGVTVVIDDRNFQPDYLGYEYLLEDEDYADWEEDVDEESYG